MRVSCRVSAEVIHLEEGVTVGTQYVQHRSGQGEKWQAMSSFPTYWKVEDKQDHETYLLPKSEYVLCDPPELWLDVTAECESIANQQQVFKGNAHVAAVYKGYRFQKVPLYTNTNILWELQWAFIVEQRKDQP
jgi:hypothetical protein